MPLDSNDVFSAYSYAIEVDNETVGMFTELDGVSIEREVITTRHNLPDGKEVTKKIPGHEEIGDLVLKRGKTEDRKLWDWMVQVNEGKMKEARKSGSIIVFTPDGEESLRYNFVNAWPSRIALQGFASGSSTMLIEECTIVHEGLTQA